MSAAAGSIAAMAFLVIAALHAYWALGGFWPGRDEESLARLVVGGPPGMRFPGRPATWAVVAVLAGGAAVVLAAADILPVPAPRGLVRGAALLGAAMLLLRAVEGVFDVRLRPDTAGTPFARLNLILYSPLCFVLALLTAASASR